MVPAIACAWSARPIEASSAWVSSRQSVAERDQKFRQWPQCASSAACTFSKTVSLGKILVRWNERPMPMPQMRCGGMPVISRPSSSTRPAVGGRWPVMRLNSVDLPAPFGPMTAAICPAATARSTSATARKPAKDLLSPCTSSTGAPPGPASQPPYACNETADDAAGEDEKQHQQDDAEHERPVFRVGGDLVVEQNERSGADHGPPEMLHAAEDGHDHHFGRFRPVDEIGEDAAAGDAEERSGDAGEAAGDHEGGELVGAHVDADERCALRVLADRRQHAAEGRADDALHRRQ